MGLLKGAAESLQSDVLHDYMLDRLTSTMCDLDESLCTALLGTSVDELIASGQASGSDVLCVLQYGTVIHDGFLEALVSLLEEQGAQQWIAFAHIIDGRVHGRDRWLWLHTQRCIINLEALRCDDINEFGESTDGPESVPVIERSRENVHDDYTPLWVRAADDQSGATTAGPLLDGWKFLRDAMMAGYTVRNVPPALRRNSRHCYPEDLPTRRAMARFVEALPLLGEPRLARVNSALQSLPETKEREHIRNLVDVETGAHTVFLENTERLRLSAAAASARYIIAPGGGLKCFLSHMVEPLRQDCTVVHFDVASAALEFQMRFLEADIHSLDDFIQAEAARLRGQGLRVSASSSGQAARKRWMDEHGIDDAHLQKSLASYRRLKHVFWRIDVVLETDQFLEMCDELVGAGTAHLHLSNLFAYQLSARIYLRSERQAALERIRRFFGEHAGYTYWGLAYVEPFQSGKELADVVQNDD